MAFKKLLLFSRILSIYSSKFFTPLCDKCSCTPLWCEILLSFRNIKLYRLIVTKKHTNITKKVINLLEVKMLI